jgi:hypothetical protein
MAPDCTATRGFLFLAHPFPPFPRRSAARRGIVTPYSFPHVSIGRDLLLIFLNFGILAF